MAISYYKDIYEYLCRKHPNKKIYVISDHHFYHSNIINYERPEFSNVCEMNEHIINSHNSVVSVDDIVIFLGDFSFKKGVIKELLSRMNGHKYLLLGNHDNPKITNFYKEMGFEGIFTSPVKINDNFLSHYPLKNGMLNDTYFKLLVQEFKKSTGINYHGHEHTENPGELPYINVCCESRSYKPLFIGYTEGIIKTTDAPLIINSKEFNDILRFLKKTKYADPKLLVSDYLYSLFLEAITPYINNTFVYGSYPLYKRYGYISDFSDLDVGLIYDENKSIKRNQSILREVFYTSFEKAKSIDNLNLSIFKRIANMSIFEILYASGEGTTYKGYFDSNLVPLDVYRDTDFVIFDGYSTMEKLLQQNHEEEVLNEFRFPKFQAKFLSTNGNIANITLQILFQQGHRARVALALKKLRYVFKISGNSNIENVEPLEDIMIRFLIRNMMFFQMTNRKRDFEGITNGYSDLNGFLNSVPYTLRLQMEEILKNPNSLFNSLYKELSSLNFEEIPGKSREIIKSLK